MKPTSDDIPLSENSINRELEEDSDIDSTSDKDLLEFDDISKNENDLTEDEDIQKTVNEDSTPVHRLDQHDQDGSLDNNNTSFGSMINSNSQNNDMNLISEERI